MIENPASPETVTSSLYRKLIESSPVRFSTMATKPGNNSDSSFHHALAQSVLVASPMQEELHSDYRATGCIITALQSDRPTKLRYRLRSGEVRVRIAYDAIHKTTEPPVVTNATVTVLPESLATSGSITSTSKGASNATM